MVVERDVYSFTTLKWYAMEDACVESRFAGTTFGSGEPPLCLHRNVHLIIRLGQPMRLLVGFPSWIFGVKADPLENPAARRASVAKVANCSTIASSDRYSAVSTSIAQA